MRMSKMHFEFLADEIAPLLHWATGVHELADKLKQTNPRFNREKFVERALKNWEARYLESLEEVNEEII